MTLANALLVIKTLLLVAILTVAAISDLRTGKVTNRFLLISLGISLLVYTGCAFFSGVLPWGESNHIHLFLSNILLSFVTSFGFYFADIWAPGDAKLFMVITLLYPLQLQAVPVGSIFPSLQILVWMFSLGFGYLVIDSAHQHWKRPKNIVATALSGYAHFSWNQIIRILMAYAVSVLLNMILSSFATSFYTSNRTLCMLMIILVCYLLGQASQKLQIIIAVAAGIGVFLHPTGQMFIQSFPIFSIMPFAIAVLIGFLSRGAHSSNYIEITADQMHAGMILSLYTYTRYPNQKILPPARAIERRLSRLNQEQAEAIANWARRKGEPILIVKTIPFAPFIAAGTILELMLGWLQHGR